MELKKSIMNVVNNVPCLYNLQVYCFYKRQFRRYLRLHHIPNVPAEGEAEYLLTWGGQYKVEPYSYRLFSRFTDRKYIVPENIGRCFIETKLNPAAMRSVYEDKNMFPFIIGKDKVPATVLCRMNGGRISDANFHPVTREVEDYLDNETPLILKPSVGSSSGQGIHLFTYSAEAKAYISRKDGSRLTKEFLMNYNENFVLQKAITQHQEIAKFNPTSVNTLRVAVYRSWKDEEPHVLASIMRVGKSGAFVDNAHAGGMYVGIDVQTGKVGEKLYDQYGISSSVWNGVDYTRNDFVIPKWNEIKSFVCDAARKIIHHRLFAFDICLNADGIPMLIEYNLDSFSYWLFMFTGQKPLGNYTEEIMEFCMPDRR